MEEAFEEVEDGNAANAKEVLATAVLRFAPNISH